MLSYDKRNLLRGLNMKKQPHKLFLGAHMSFGAIMGEGHKVIVLIKWRSANNMWVRRKSHWAHSLLHWIMNTLRNVITKTRLYNFDTLKPNFYVVKLGFTGVYIICLISAQNIDCGYSLELPRRGSSNEYPQSMFWAEIWKISEFFIWKFSIFGGKIFSIFE